MDTNDFKDGLHYVLEEIEQMLLSKNAAYGNSALDPIRVFSTASPEEQIRVRIDDKLSRLARGNGGQEDTELDLLGYLVVLRIFKKLEQHKAQMAEIERVKAEVRHPKIRPPIVLEEEND